MHRAARQVQLQLQGVGRVDAAAAAAQRAGRTSGKRHAEAHDVSPPSGWSIDQRRPKLIRLLSGARDGNWRCTL
ncbi:hypothetical protein AB1Y20_005787 [Prymnesium parvum]|uniref:Uncharacterized protein n=1 Tax=Prymnesium parvum TaxID=97485 RepID=A0AB34J1D5_PRYPA